MDSIPPHDVETEKAVIGAMLTTKAALKIAMAMLTVSDFYIGNHQDIFDICHLIQPLEVDELTLRNKYVSLGRIPPENIGGMVMTGNAAHVETYCLELQRLSRARKLKETAIEALQDLDTDGDGAAKRALEKLSKIEADPNEVNPIDAMNAQIESEIDGTRSGLDIPYFGSMATTQCFLPGTITVICGSAGASKSLFTGELAWRLFQDGAKVAKLNLESAPEFHLRRVLAQMSGDSRVTNAKHAKFNPTEIRECAAMFEKDISELVKARVLQVPAAGKRMDCAALLRWISQSADDGKQVLIIDPVTMMDTGERGWIDQQRFIQGARGIVDRKQVRLILVTHPRKNGTSENSPIHLDNISGSTAFAWFVDSVFWLEAHTAIQKMFVSEVTHQTYSEDYNRTMHVLKARLGMSERKKIAYFMDSTSLRHIERGFIE